ncbi:MAG TPA: homoserine kinase [Candidatus Polarisedimenticolia bacterium]|nr:homoserine kinase [Candidatus Polarisedimenticolia bacterium]
MSEEPRVTVFAPATVANVACGFDILGFALESPGDEVEASRRTEPGVAIVSVTGDGGRLPTDPRRNTAGVAAQALLDETGCADGVSLSVRKGMPLASGLGSSAASAVAAVVAVNELLGLKAAPDVLLRSAVAAERAASGFGHADNSAACLHGGFVLVRGGPQFEVVSLPVPDGLACALLRPHIEVGTGASRALLGETVLLKDAVVQWGNVAGLVAGLYRGDLSLVGRCLTDVVAEPKRAPQVPGFDAVKRAALDAGALGCSLSGSGPSLFALCRSIAEARRVVTRMAEALKLSSGLAGDPHVSRISPAGARVVPRAPRS